MITRVAKRQVAGAAALETEVRLARPDDLLSLLVQRGKQSIWLTPKKLR